MPLPLLFIGIAAATGGVGLGAGVKAGVDVTKASSIKKSATEMVNDSGELLERQRKACDNSLQKLGEEKLYVLNSTMKEFLDAFSKIKNVDFKDVTGFEELKEIEIESAIYGELQDYVLLAGTIGAGTVAGTAGGAILAFGAYNAAQSLACAGTGIAIKELAGAAAAKATLAYFGGGPLAAGGLGIAGGTAVLTALAAGPAVMVAGLVAGAAAKKDLEKAYTNKAEAMEIAERMNTQSTQCEAIRRRTYVFYNLLARLDTYFLPLIYKMEDIIKAEGNDYSLYKPESKKAIASCVSVAISIKGVLDTQMLTEDGFLTESSEIIAEKTEESISKMDKETK